VGVAGVSTPPYRIETERLVIRCYDPADARLLKDAVDRSRDHLWEWMPWTPAEPEELSVVVERLRMFRAQFDFDQNWIYGVFIRDESRLVAGTGLHPRGGPGSLEIGYWVAVDALRQGIATEVTAVLARVAVEICGVQRVDVQIDPMNEASVGVPMKLGFVHEATLRRRLDPKRGSGLRRDAMLYTLLAEELPESACAAYGYVAFDAAGTRLGRPV
jgi:RimJ/RimL family protein N-acetyltransferase